MPKDTFPGFKPAMDILDHAGRDFRNDAKKILGITTDTQFYNYRNGRQELSAPQREALEKLFNDYGVLEPFSKRPHSNWSAKSRTDHTPAVLHLQETAQAAARLADSVEKLTFVAARLSSQLADLAEAHVLTPLPRQQELVFYPDPPDPSD